VLVSLRPVSIGFFLLSTPQFPLRRVHTPLVVGIRSGGFPCLYSLRPPPRTPTILLYNLLTSDWVLPSTPPFDPRKPKVTHSSLHRHFPQTFVDHLFTGLPSCATLRVNAVGLFPLSYFPPTPLHDRPSPPHTLPPVPSAAAENEPI